MSACSPLGAFAVAEKGADNYRMPLPLAAAAMRRALSLSSAENGGSVRPSASSAAARRFSIRVMIASPCGSWAKRSYPAR